MAEITLLYSIPEYKISNQLHYMWLFMRYVDFIEGDFIYTIEEGNKFVVIHNPENGDMCTLYNHPRIIKELQKYGIYRRLIV